MGTFYTLEKPKKSSKPDTEKPGLPEARYIKARACPKPEKSRPGTSLFSANEIRTFSEWLFSGKIQFATLSKIQITIFYCFKQFLKELGCFFFTKAFKTFCIKFCLLDLHYFYLNNEFSRKEDFISSFNTFCFGQPCASFCQSARYSKREQSNVIHSFLR